MVIPASLEFISLCQSQTTLLTQGLGASSSGIYLTADLVEGSPANLIPVVVYPEASAWTGLSSSLSGSTGHSAHLSSTDTATPETGASPDLLQAATQRWGTAASLSQSKQQRLVLPLMDQQLVMGLLVVGREDRQWKQQEQLQLEQIANTLAIARVLDQRQQWSAHADQHRRLLQAQQQDTLANLLHQFRNPLTTLRTLGKLLLKRLGPTDANCEVATSIIRESERLQDLLQQFNWTVERGQVALEAELEASPLLRLAGRTDPADDPLPGVPRLLPPAGLTVEVELPLQPCSIAQVLDPLLHSALAIAAERNLALQADVPSMPPVRANPQALREVLSNLIDNALKYTPAPGQVSVQVCRKQLELGSYQAVAVHDTGPGIPSADLAHVFERHYRGVQAQTDIPGTGLGLAIAHELVKQMQGKIQVFSPALASSNLPDQSPGPGSTFIVWLPEINTEA